MRSYEERKLAWTSVYITVMAMIVTYLYTTASPSLDFTHALLLLVVVYASILAAILAVLHVARRSVCGCEGAGESGGPGGI